MNRAGYWELLRSNPNFRRLWIGDVVSLLGDWFNTIALYTLVRQLTGSPLALGLVFLTKMLPFALASPLAGWITDRFDRRRLMIATDLARAAVVLGFLAVETAADLPLLYSLIALQMALGAVFIPARSASIPNLTTPRELLTANALSAATWSILLAVGSALGGFVTAGFGTGTVFVLDSTSYLVSAFFLFRLRMPRRTKVSGTSLAAAFSGILEGWRHLRDNPAVGRIALTKPAWALGGGALVYLLTLMGEEIAPAAPAVGIGLLFAARGLGTGIGPVAVRALVPEEGRWPRVIGLGITASGLTYLVTSQLPWSLVVMGLIVLAHVPSGANWVMSTVLLQKRAPDRFRGRVFSTEWLLITLVDSVAILAASLLLDRGGLSLRTAVALFAAVQIVTGMLWLWIVVPREQQERGSTVRRA